MPQPRGAMVRRGKDTMGLLVVPPLRPRSLPWLRCSRRRRANGIVHNASLAIRRLPLPHVSPARRQDRVRKVGEQLEEEGHNLAVQEVLLEEAGPAEHGHREAQQTHQQAYLPVLRPQSSAARPSLGGARLRAPRWCLGTDRPACLGTHRPPPSPARPSFSAPPPPRPPLPVVLPSSAARQ
jgi:hypothetical protein